MKKLKAIWELMRLEHGIMIAIAILVGSIVAKQQLPMFSVFLLTFCTALFLEASTFALNDYYDYEIDKKNKRMDRPLVRGDLSPHTAVYLFAVLFPLGILCSYFVNLTCFVIALITALFAVVYDMYLKKIKLVGNFFIAYTMAIPFVFGGTASLSIQGLSLTGLPVVIYVLACIAFLAGAGREIMKDVMDFKGDQHLGVRSFPRYLGEKKSNGLAAMFYLVAIGLSFLPYSFASFGVYYQNFYYLVLIFITDTMLLSTVIHLLFSKHPQLDFHRKFTLGSLFVGLIGFLIGAFTG